MDGAESGYCKVPEPVEGKGKALYEYGHAVTNVRDVGKQVEVEYETTAGLINVATADLLIAADGPSSTIRKIFLPEVKRKYVGYVA